LSLKQTVYFMALVGGLAGLICWFVQVWVADQSFAEEQKWIVMLVNTTVMGALIGGMTVAFADHWTADRVVPKWVLMGVGLGVMAGATSTLVFSVSRINASLINPDPNSALAFLGRTLAWILSGTLIGFFVGLRWSGVNKLRAFHAAIGGLAGGLLGGMVFAWLGGGSWYAGYGQALAFMITGTCITLGVTLAPVLLKDGVLQFISSGVPRAQNKYGSPRQEWVVQDGDTFVIGSQGADLTQTMYSRDVQIYIPDAKVGPRHAVLFAQNKRFFIQPHSDNIGRQGQPELPILVGDASVVRSHELHGGDEVVLGQTLLRFLTKKKSDAPGRVADRGGF
jgi:hypothetical protein